MKIESLREVKNNFSAVIEDLEKTGPVVVTKNGKGRALLIPIDDAAAWAKLSTRKPKRR